MREGRMGVWMLRRLMPAAHADVLYGDLFEISAGDRAEVRRLLLATVWSLVWRSLAGYALAAVVGGLCTMLLQIQFFASMDSHICTGWQRSWGSIVALAVGLMSMVVCYSVVRYGLHDRMTQLAAAYLAPGVLAVVFWWVPGVPILASLSFAGYAGYAIGRRASRSMLTALLVLTVMMPSLWMVGLTALLTPAAMLWKYPLSTAIDGRPLMAAWLVACYCALMLMTCAVYAKSAG